MKLLVLCSGVFVILLGGACCAVARKRPLPCPNSVFIDGVWLGTPDAGSVERRFSVESEPGDTAPAKE